MYKRQFEVIANGTHAIDVPYVVSCVDGEMWFPVHSLHKKLLAILAPIASKHMLVSALRSVTQPPSDASLCNAPPMVRRRLYELGWIKSNVRHVQLARVDAVAQAFHNLGIHEYMVAQIEEGPKVAELQEESEGEESEHGASHDWQMHAHESEDLGIALGDGDFNSAELVTTHNTQATQVG